MSYDRDYPGDEFTVDDPRAIEDERTIRQERALLTILLCLTTDHDAPCGVAA